MNGVAWRGVRPRARGVLHLLSVQQVQQMVVPLGEQAEFEDG